MNLWHPRDPLGREGAPGNPFWASCFFERLVTDLLPGLPPGLHEPAVIPCPFFLPEPITIDVPSSGHGVDVRVSGLRVDREIDDHAGVDQGL